MNRHVETVSVDTEWRDGWPVVLGAFIGMIIPALIFFTHGLFMKPLGKEFGWSRSELSAAAMIVSVVTAAGMPFVGRLADRIGPRKLVLVGWIVAMGGFGALGFMVDHLALYWATWVVISIGILLSGPVTLTACISSRFERHRGLAIALALNSVNIVGAIVPLLAVTLIDAVGWRASYFILAAGAFALGYPIVLATIFPAQRPQHVFAGAAPTRAVTGTTLGEAARTREFWSVGFAMLLIGSSLVASFVHFVPSLTDRGVSPASAAFAISAYSVAGIGSGLAIGFLLDRHQLSHVGAIMIGLSASGGAILTLGGGGVPGAVAAATALGFGSGGAMPMLSYFVARRFGTEHYGAIFSVMMSMFVVSQGAGAVLVGVIHDHTGSYTTPFAMASGALLLAAGLLHSLGEPRPRPG